MGHGTGYSCRGNYKKHRLDLIFLARAKLQRGGRGRRRARSIDRLDWREKSGPMSRWRHCTVENRRSSMPVVLQLALVRWATRLTVTRFLPCFAFYSALPQRDLFTIRGRRIDARSIVRRCRATKPRRAGGRGDNTYRQLAKVGYRSRVPAAAPGGAGRGPARPIRQGPFDPIGRSVPPAAASDGPTWPFEG